MTAFHVEYASTGDARSLLLHRIFNSIATTWCHPYVMRDSNNVQAVYFVQFGAVVTSRNQPEVTSSRFVYEASARGMLTIHRRR